MGTKKKRKMIKRITDSIILSAMTGEAYDCKE